MKKEILDGKNIVGVGVDIEEIARFRERPFEKNKHFYQKIFTPKEIAYCLKKAKPAQHFAARFCAKEAFVKASRRKIVDLKEIEVVVERNKPKIKQKNSTVFLSLSHDRGRAIAYVVIVKNTSTTIPRS